MTKAPQYLDKVGSLCICSGRERQLHGMLENIAGNTGNLAASAGELGKSGSLRPKAEGVTGQIVLQTGRRLHRLQHHEE